MEHRVTFYLAKGKEGNRDTVRKNCPGKIEIRYLYCQKELSRKNREKRDTVRKNCPGKKGNRDTVRKNCQGSARRKVVNRVTATKNCSSLTVFSDSVYVPFIFLIDPSDSVLCSLFFLHISF